MILIIVLILVLFTILYFKRTHTDNFEVSRDKINLVTKLNRCKQKSKNKVYQIRPIQYDCLPNNAFETEEDKFIDNYVYKSKLFCKKNTDDYAKKNLAIYRDRFFDFRNKTNIDTNMITPVDNINEMRLLNPELQGQSIADIYDTLTSNKPNLIHQV